VAENLAAPSYNDSTATTSSSRNDELYYGTTGLRSYVIRCNSAHFAGGVCVFPMCGHSLLSQSQLSNLGTVKASAEVVQLFGGAGGARTRDQWT
jgi:hypothetical protein